MVDLLEAHWPSMAQMILRHIRTANFNVDGTEHTVYESDDPKDSYRFSVSTGLLPADEMITAVKNDAGEYLKEVVAEHLADAKRDGHGTWRAKRIAGLHKAVSPLASSFVTDDPYVEITFAASTIRPRHQARLSYGNDEDSLPFVYILNTHVVFDFPINLSWDSYEYTPTLHEKLKVDVPQAPALEEFVPMLLQTLLFNLGSNWRVTRRELKPSDPTMFRNSAKVYGSGMPTKPEDVVRVPHMSVEYFLERVDGKGQSKSGKVIPLGNALNGGDNSGKPLTMIRPKDEDGRPEYRTGPFFVVPLTATLWRPLSLMQLAARRSSELLKDRDDIKVVLPDEIRTMLIVNEHESAKRIGECVACGTKKSLIQMSISSLDKRDYVSVCNQVCSDQYWSQKM